MTGVQTCALPISSAVNNFFDPQNTWTVELFGRTRHPLVAVCKQCELICNRYCEHYEEEICTHRFKPPYVCNGCSEVKKCTLTKTVYDALEAQRQATEKISESRSGILATEGELARLNAILVPLVKQGQSIHQIYLTHKDELMCSEKTLYNYVDGCLFDIRNPRVCPVKNRKYGKISW